MNVRSAGAMVFMTAVLLNGPALAAFGGIPEAPAARRLEFDAPSAAALLKAAFGLLTTEVTETEESFVFEVKGFVDSRKCPLAGIRDSGCGSFEWIPSRAVVYRNGWEGPVSGHLARNRIAAVDMQSDSAGFAFGSMHGVLVAPSAGISKSHTPAFGWYLSRSGRSLSVDLADISGDGVADVVYTFDQMLPGGVSVVPHDVWTFEGMTAAKYISSGEKISGVSTTTFEGVPLLRDSEDRVDRGRFHFVSPGGAEGGESSAVPKMLIIERAVFHSGSSFPDWEIQAVADLPGQEGQPSGWMEYLSVTGNPGGSDSDRMDDSRCVVSDLPPEVPIGARRVFLDIEEACRIADRPFPSGAPLFRSAVMAFRGLVLTVRGLPVLGAAFFESAAVEALAAGHSLKAVLYSAAAAFGTGASLRSACAGATPSGCFRSPGDAGSGLIVSGPAASLSDLAAAIDGSGIFGHP